MLAIALSSIVKALASGRHYASSASAGFVPGIDGVGVDETGRHVYGCLAARELIAGAGELLSAAPSAGFTARFVPLPLRAVGEA